jgi:sugar lactone lactonase YvrE
VVLVALCLTLVLGVAVAGYVAVCARTMDMSNRSFCTTSSVQLAEIGMEEALWSLNQALNTSGYTWPGWTLAIVSGVPTATKQLTGFPTNKGIQSQVKIRIDNYNIDQNTTPPQSYTQPLTITVDGISLMPGGIAIDKQLVATVKPAALFSNAVGSTGSSDLVSFVNASGGIVDSYDSTPTAPNNGIYTPYPYADPSIVNRSDQAIISGSLLNIQDAVILGYATTANSTPNPPSYFSTNGTVTRLTSTGATSTFPPIDYSRISNNANQYVFDFVASLPGSYAGNIDSLNFHDGSAVIGTPGGPLKRYDATALSLAGNDVLTINGPVIIDVSGNSVIPGDLTIQGSAKIVVTKGADPAHDGSAQIFIRDVAANMDIGGVADVYVADYDNHIIRKITPAGVVSTLAGMAGASGSTDGTGNAARFDFPSGVAVDSAGSVYVADTSNHTIRMITPTGVVSTLAGMAGASGSTDDTGSAARFSSPSGVIVDSSGNVYVADTGNDTIRKITPAREVTTLAGTGGSAGSADGTGSAARFNSPGGVAVDDAGNVYVADTSNHTIRKITPAGAVTTPAGSAGVQGSADGTGSAAQFNTPKAVAVDSAGNVYVADTSNDTIRKITPAGVVTTLAGSPGVPGSADGTGSAARFNLPGGVAVDYA